MLPLAVWAADAQSNDKNGCNLFNPVPDDQLRPLSSGHYDGLTDARTLDAGHVQLESGLINYYFNSSTPRQYAKDQFLWEPRINVGLLNNVDFFVRPAYEVKTDYANRSSGEFERVNTGVRVNLWGNESGTTALAVQPYLSIPTSGGDVALLVRLPYGFSVKFDSDFYALENNNNTLFAGFNNGLSLNKSLCSQADATGI